MTGGDMQDELAQGGDAGGVQGQPEIAEHWDAADEPAAAIKIPELAASFPLNDPA